MITQNNIIRKGIPILLIITLLLTGFFITPNISQAETIKEIKTDSRDIYDLAYYDIWKHEDGTWQNGIKQDASVSQTYPITESVVPQGAKIISVTGEFNSTFKDGMYWDYSVPYATVSNVHYGFSIGTIKTNTYGDIDYEVSTTLDTNSGRLKSIKQPWQAANVEGYRYFIPVHFHIEYEIEVTTEIPDPPAPEDINAAVEAPSTAKTGETFTVSDATKVGSETVLDSSTLTRSVDGGAWEYVQKWEGTGSKGSNTGGSVQQTFDKVCVVEYKITSVTEGGKEDTGSKITEIQDGRVIGGNADLQLPKYTYEGHTVEAEDYSMFTVDGVSYNGDRAYYEKLASNRFTPVPNTAAQIKRTSRTSADVTFPKRGNYAVRLDIDMKDGQKLTDTEEIEVRKTPYVYENLGGVQKQNRKQILNAMVATYPDKPIVDYYIELRDMKTGDSILLTKDKPQDNNATIKTRIHTKNGDGYWTNFKLEFLTKTPAYKEGGDNSGQEFRYTIYVKDSKGDTDIAQKTFTVLPDMPPNPKIIMPDTFIRNKGTNTAKITAEDGTTTDGDQLKRTWSVGGVNIKDLPGYVDQSFGSGQKVQFNKDGVGKVTAALHVKDVWNEPTLEEYITDADYLESSTTKTTDVVNIAPTVRLEPIKTEATDIVILTDKASKSAIEAGMNNLKASLIEAGIDYNIQLLTMATENKEGYKQVGNWEWGVSRNCSCCNSEGVTLDSDFAYKVESSGKTSKIEYGNTVDVCIAPHILSALEGGNNVTGAPQRIAWSYTIKESKNFTIQLDNEEQYVYILCNDMNQTILLNRDTGAYVTTLNVLLPGQIYVTPRNENIYCLLRDKIQKYDMRSGKLTTALNKGGSLGRIQNGKITFVGKESSQRFYIGSFDMGSEILSIKSLAPLPVFEWKQGETSDLSPVDMDISGKVVFMQMGRKSDGNNAAYNIWVADSNSRAVSMCSSGPLGAIYTISVGFVTDETGQGRYIYTHTRDSRGSGSKRDDVQIINVYEMDKKGQLTTAHTVHSSSARTTKWNYRGISYAKMNSQENTMYIVQGADYNDYEWVLGARCKVDLSSWGASSFGTSSIAVDGWAWLDENGGYDNNLMGNTFQIEKDADMEKQLKMYRLPITEEQSKTYALNKNASFRSDAKRYIYEAKELGESLFKNIVEKITYERDNPSGENVLYLKGDGKENLSAVMKEISLEPKQQYQYEYKLTNITGKAVDIFQPYKEDAIDNTAKKMYGGIIAETQFKSPGTDGIFTYTGGAYGFPGIGGSVDSDNVAKGYSCSVNFSMEEDGWVEFDSYRGLSSGTSSITIDGVTQFTESAVPYGTVQHKMKLLSKGAHTIVAGGSAHYGYTGIGNLKIGYLSLTRNTNFQSAALNNAGSGTVQMVRNTFEGRLGELFEVKEPIIKNVTNEMFKGNIASKKGGVEFTESWGFSEASRSAGMTASWGNSSLRGGMNVTAPSDQFVVLSFKEYLNLPSVTSSSTEGNAIEIYREPTTGNVQFVIPPGGYLKKTYTAIRKTGYGGTVQLGSYTVSNIKTVAIDPNEVDYRQILNLDMLNTNFSFAPLTQNFWTVDLGQDSDSICTITNHTAIDENTKNASNSVMLNTNLVGDINSAFYVTDFKLYRLWKGMKELVMEESFRFVEKLEDKGWLPAIIGTGKAEIIKVIPPKEEEEAPLIYKKGQLVAYNIFYDDYENDPSKKQYWKYTHTPMNDGENPDAAVILDEDGNIVSSGGTILSASIPRFYIDGKYTVEHWQEDNTTRGVNPNGNPGYDKISNVESITFYIEGGASAPWVTSIKTLPAVVKEGSSYKLQIGVDDAEKDELRLTTELYKDKKLIYTHKQTGIKANASGVYPLTITGDAPLAQGGKYEVVCTVRDWSGAGMGTYKFTVVSEGKITGYVNHTDQWNINRKKYNLKKSGSEESPRGYNVFWSGEKFMLESAVAGSPTLVTSQIVGYPDYKITMKSTGRKNAQNETIYAGEMWDKSMINKWGRKAPQPLTFKFTATYSGGLVKTHDVVVIVDSKQDYWQLHRLF